MSRMSELLARRRMLIARCELERLELAARMAQLRGARRGGSGAPASHPLAWVAALAAMLLLGRTRDVLSLMVWVRTALSLVSGAGKVLRLIARLRAAPSAAA